MKTPDGFGSSDLLHQCWSDTELSGAPVEKLGRRSTSAAAPEAESSLPGEEPPPLPMELQGSIRSVVPEGNRKIIALTFDLCETAGEIYGYDSEVVDYLREHGVKATFFAGGKWMKSHPERTMQLMADPLFEIGNHSWTHKNFRAIQPREMEEQILFTQAQYRRLREELAGRPCALHAGERAMESIPKLPALFRFPFGTCTSQALEMLSRYGLAAIQWNIVSGDPDKHQTSSGIARIVLTSVKPGSIVICHANGRGHGTAGALPMIVPKLRALGYEFVTVSELLAAGRPIAAKECYEQRPGDNLNYGAKPGKGKRGKQ